MAGLPAGRGAARLAVAGAALAILVGGLGNAWECVAGPLMPAAPPGRNESGAPVFVILGEEALGLNGEPTDLHLMPDGRILVVAPRRLVFGDGTRWTTVPEIDSGLALPGCAVDKEGQIFFGTPGGFGRVRYDDNGRWHVEKVAPWPAEEPPDRVVPLRAVEAGSEWIWHSDSGSVISWRPGQAARTITSVERVSLVFVFRGVPYVSDASNGRLSRLVGAGEDVFPPATMSLKDAITSALPWKGDLELVGTVGRGLELFDGRSLVPFRASGILATDATVNDLCQTEGNLYAAAIENFGIVFFDGDGQVVQTLDRTLDHRLAHVKKLLPTGGGTILGLVDHGLLEVEFPSRVSNMEPLVSVGVTIPTVNRFQGDLWIYSAEKLLRGIYNADGRLVRFDLDTPPGRDVTSFAVIGDRLVAGTDRGAFWRTPSGWLPFASATMDLRVLSPVPRDGRWLYGAQNEIGWLRATATGFEVEPIPARGLERVHSSHSDRNGRIWLELGVGRVGRIDFRDGVPTLAIFAVKDGLPNGWVAPFEIDGRVTFNVSGRWLRFDDVTRRFVADADFVAKIAGLVNCVGRPCRDALGRLWVSALNSPQVLDDRGSGPPRNLHEKFPLGLEPWTYFPEDDGVMWMVSYHRLVRYDPAIPAAPAAPLRALITHVTLPASNRVLGAATELPALDFSDNSLAVHFVAPGHSFASSVTFEVMLEGAGAGWTPIGSSGTAAFNRLKEGRYVLHVLPRVGDARGTEATLAFSIRPPWFRTPLAWALYSGLALGLFALSVGLVAFLHRRENVRLEKLVTERTASLRASEARLQLEFELMPTGCIVWSPDRRVARWNPAAERIFGYPAGEALGRRAEDLVVAPIAPLDEAGFWAPDDAEALHWHRTVRNVTKTGQVIWCEWTNAPLRDEGGVVLGIMSMVENVTERRALEEQLHQSQKMEGIGKLAGGVAHDFNNILTAMTLIVDELCAARPAPGSPLADLQSLTNRAARLTQQLLVFARKHVMQFATVDLNLVVGEVMKMLGRLIGEHVTVRLELDARALWIEADVAMLDQMIMNLCLNARDAMPQGGTLTLATCPVEFQADDTLTHPECRPGQFACLRISDSGVGMDADILAHVFEPFFTTKEVGQGTGLGLASVYGIVHQHQGWIEVESAVGHGSTFRVFLPVARRPAGTPTQAPTQAASRRGTGTILLVEDEEPVRRVAKALLERLGYRVLAATDGPSAMELWKAHGGEVDLLLTDMVMPNGMTGVELGNLFRQTRPQLKIVVMSGYSEEVVGAGTEPGGRIAFLAKPFQSETVAEVVRQSLEG